MPVSLRQPNNPTPDLVLLNALVVILNTDTQGNYNTQLAQSSQSGTGKELMFVQNKYKMSLSLTPASPYAVHLSSGKQSYHYAGGPRWRGGMYEALVQYYARWDTQPSSIDAIRAYLAADLERMKANIERNDSLASGGVAYAVSVPTIGLSDYKGQFDETFSGLTLIYRTMTLTIDILPYDC